MSNSQVSSHVSLEYLEKQNPCIEFDPHVTFHDFYTDPETKNVKEHVYLVKLFDKLEIYDTSVTPFVHSFFPHFDADSIIANMIKGNKWKNDVSYAYYRKSPEDIKSMWDQNGKQASSLGTLMHARIEKFYNHPTLWKMIDDSKLSECFNEEEMNNKEIRQFINFHLDGPAIWHWIPWRTELRIFDRDIRVAGSIDMLYKSPNYTEKNKLLIMLDWKRSKEIAKINQYRKKAFSPIQDLVDANFWQYSLQLNVYKRIIEKNTVYKIEYMALGVFHPNYETYQIFPVDDMKNHIDKIWIVRLNQLKKAIR